MLQSSEHLRLQRESKTLAAHAQWDDTEHEERIGAHECRIAIRSLLSGKNTVMLSAAKASRLSVETDRFATSAIDADTLKA